MGLLVSDHSLRVSTARRPTGAMVKHNNLLPNGHFKKFWQLRVRTWFDQAGQKKRRRLARKEKAQAVFPRPAAGALRPVVRAPTNKYNRKLRAGRGFAFAELAEAGISPAVAQTIGIAIDHRRSPQVVQEHAGAVPQEGQAPEGWRRFGRCRQGRWSASGRGSPDQPAQEAHHAPRHQAGGARHGQDWSAEERRMRHGCTRPRRCPFGWCARQEGRSGGGEEEASIVMRLNRPVCVSGLTRCCEVNNTKK